MAIFACLSSVAAEAQTDKPKREAATPHSDYEAAQMDPATFDKLMQKSAERPVRVIVQMNIAPALEKQVAAGRAAGAADEAAAIATTKADVMDRLAGAEVSSVRAYRSVPMMAMDVGPEALKRLANDPAVLSIQEDVAEPPSLLQSVALIGGTNLHNDGIDGRGTAVAILDTGVDTRHPFLGGRVVEEACFSSNTARSQGVCPNGQDTQVGSGSGGPCGVEGCDHGTHVAGIAAGASNPFSGVAPGADIVAVQVFSVFADPEDCGDSPAPCVLTFRSDQIAALEHVGDLARTRDIAAVNMSLGGGAYSSNCDTDPRKASIDTLRRLGTATAIASGNDGLDGSVNAPGCISSAVTVGSTTKRDAVSGFSNLGRLVDLMAPGSAINSSIPGGLFAIFNGTSMATPHVAGAFALLKSAAGDRSVAELEEALKSTGVSVSRAGLSKPRIQVDAALVALQGGTGQPVNDDFADALVLAGTDASATGMNMGATREPGEPVHAGAGGGSSVWWRWTAPASGEVTIETRGSDFDTVLAAYRGSAINSLTEIASNDDVRASILWSRVTFDAASGRTYFIAVDGFGDEEGDIALKLELEGGGAVVRNDNFGRALRLAGARGRTTGTNVGATLEPGEPVHAQVGGGASVWWKWRAVRTGRAVFTTAGSSFDTILAVYAGSRLASLREIASNDDTRGLGLQSRVSFRAVAGRLYRVAVDGYEGAAGDITLRYRARGRSASVALN